MPGRSALLWSSAAGLSVVWDDVNNTGTQYVIPQSITSLYNLPVEACDLLRCSWLVLLVLLDGHKRPAVVSMEYQSEAELKPTSLTDYLWKLSCCCTLYHCFLWLILHMLRPAGPPSTISSRQHYYVCVHRYTDFCPYSKIYSIFWLMKLDIPVYRTQPPSFISSKQFVHDVSMSRIRFLITSWNRIYISVF